LTSGLSCHLCVPQLARPASHAMPPVQVDLDDPTSFDRQMYDEILFDDPTLPDYQVGPDN